MGDFVTGNRPLPARKVDARPPITPEQEIDAADVNDLWDAAKDLRDAIQASIPAVNVKAAQYGAKGDGATDDTAAIQAAVNAGAALGMPVVVPPGTYMIAARMTTGPQGAGWDHTSDTGGIKLPSNTHLVIQAGATLKAITSDWYAGNVLRVLNASNVTIEGPGAIVGDRATHDMTNPGVLTPIDRSTQEFWANISVRGGTDVTIRGLSLSGSTGDAITCGANTATDNNTQRIRILGNRLDGSRRNNISVIDRSSDVVIQGNAITNGGSNDPVHALAGTPPRAGIDVEGGSVSGATSPEGVVIQGNTFRGNWGAAVSDFNGRGTVISNNFADGSIGYGFAVDTTIQGNTLREASRLAPANFAAFNITATYLKGDLVQSGGAFYTSLKDANVGNTPPNATWWQVYTATAAIYGLGLSASMDTNSATVIGNTINGYDIGIDLRGANAIAIGNHIYKPRSKGLNGFSIVGVIFDGNEIFQAPTGVNLDTTATQATVSNNYVEGSTTVGIISTSTSAVIRGNRVRFSLVGIRVTGGTASIVANDIRPDGVPSESNSISISGASTVVTVKGNIVRGATNTAFIASSNPTLRLVGNEFTGNTTASFAVSITSTSRVEIVDNVISFARASNGGTGLALLGGTTGALVLSNKIYTENAFTLTNPIITTASAGSNKVVNNITSTGTVTLHATDTNTGNVTF